MCCRATHNEAPSSTDFTAFYTNSTSAGEHTQHNDDVKYIKYTVIDSVSCVTVQCALCTCGVSVVGAQSELWLL
jgi:hypothetical protein